MNDFSDQKQAPGEQWLENKNGKENNCMDISSDKEAKNIGHG